MKHLALIFGALGGVGLVATYFFQWAWQRGYKQGFEAGARERFWAEAERDVDQARKDIWKEEESA